MYNIYLRQCFKETFKSQIRRLASAITVCVRSQQPKWNNKNKTTIVANRIKFSRKIGKLRIVLHFSVT